MEKDKKKDYYDEEKVWTKRKPKIKTKEQIEEELIEEKNNHKRNIICYSYNNYNFYNIYTSKDC